MPEVAPTQQRNMHHAEERRIDRAEVGKLVAASPPNGRTGVGRMFERRTRSVGCLNDAGRRAQPELKAAFG